MVDGNFEFDFSLKFTGDAQLILMDNTQTKFINYTALAAEGNLSIYGQAKSLGVLSAYYVDFAKNMTVNGGGVLAVRLYGEDETSGQFTLNAGVLETEEIRSKNIRLGWRGADDHIGVKGYRTDAVTIVEGKYFKESKSGKIYGGTLSAQEIDDIGGKLLVPYIRSLPDEKFTVAKIPDQTYTGSKICPDLTVTNGETTLEAGKDYKAVCTNNINVGKASVDVYGIGNYEGNISANFVIVEADPTITKAPAAIDDLRYNGQSQTLISAGEAKNGVMVYKLSGEENYSENLPAATEVGEYTVYFMVKGNDNYNDIAAQTLTVSIGEPESSSSDEESSSSDEDSSSSSEESSSSDEDDSSSSVEDVSSSSVADVSSSSKDKSSSSSKKDRSSSSRDEDASSSSDSGNPSSSSAQGKTDGFAPVVASPLNVQFIRNELIVAVPTSSELKVFVFDMQGSLKKQYHGNSAGTHSVSLNQMNRGMYLVRVVSGSDLRTLRVNVK